MQEKKQIPPEALRALAEAEERKKNTENKMFPKELGGGKGPEPVRFGDWERKGRCTDY